MTPAQRIIKYGAIAFAIFLIAAIVSGAVSVILFIVGDDSIAEDPVTIAISEDVQSLDLDLAATSLFVKVGESFKVETNNLNLSFDSENGTLYIDEERHRPFGSSNEAVLILTVPADAIFESVEIDTGAGMVELESLSAERVEFNFGAGEVRIDALYVSSYADIDGGAGRIEIDSGRISALELDMGAGELQLRASLLGSSEINCGVGRADVTLLGAESDYAVSVSRGIGEVTVGGKTARDGETVGSGANRLYVSGGIGEISVTFEEIGTET